MLIVDENEVTAPPPLSIDQTYSFSVVMTIFSFAFFLAGVILLVYVTDF